MEQKCWFGIFNRTRCRVDYFFFAFFLFSEGCRALSLEFGPSVTVILLHLLILLNWNVRFIVRDHFVAWSTRRCFDPSDKLHDIGELCLAFWCMEFAYEWIDVSSIVGKIKTNCGWIWILIILETYKLSYKILIAELLDSSWSSTRLSSYRLLFTYEPHLTLSFATRGVMSIRFLSQNTRLNFGQRPQNLE